MPTRRLVLLVVGPPCAGKSTLARQLADEFGAEVVDFDAIAQRLGSKSSHDHPPMISRRAVREQQRLERQVASARVGAWVVVRTAADPVQRERLAAQLHADQTLVVDPGREVVTERARRLRPRHSLEAIAEWYRLNARRETSNSVAAVWHSEQLSSAGP